MSETAAAIARRNLVERLLRGEATAARKPEFVIGRRDPAAAVPLSPAQRQVWLHAGMAPEVPLYNESITIHRHGSFDLAVMQACLDALLQRHESWRTFFTFDGVTPIQHILPTLAVELPLTDVSHLPAAERNDAAVAAATADARAAIDLGRAPLLRARVVRLSADDHRLYLTLHHIIFDGVAIYRVILPELVALYEAFAAGLPSPLPPPTLGYGDYAVWAARAAENDSAGQRSYWRRTLADLPPKLDLPADRAMPPVPSHAGSMEVFSLTADLTEGLKSLARRADATLYMTLLAAFKAMLFRYTEATDIVIGGVTDLRRRPELQSVVGYFLNTLPLRSRPSAETPFLTYLGEVRDSVLGALSASELPFDQIVACAQARAALGSHPLFDILFSVEPPVEPFPPGWDLTQMDVVVGAAKFDLYLELDERPDGMAGRFLYSTERFDAATIRSMIGHWRAILEAISVDPACALIDLPLIPPASVSERPAPSIAAPDQPTVPEQVADMARAAPGTPAVRFGARAWSYAELDHAADRVAASLRSAGLGPGALVAVLLERAPEMVAALLGTLRAGAAYLPLDPRQPVERLRRIAGDAEADGLLTERALVGLVPNVAGPTVLVENRDAAPAWSGPPPRPDGLAYTLYTSGSGGQPKGVEIEHRALSNLLASMAERPGFGAGDRLLAVTTVSFDIAALELFLPLTCGGELVLAPFDVTRDPARLADLIRDVRPSVMQATPATWLALLDAGWTGDERLRVLCGGEALSRSLADRLLACTGEVWNLYGPTETCIWSTVAKVRPGSDAVPIGTAIANTSLHVLDARGRAVPPGIPGELFIGGAGLARGYRGRPDLTAERFGPAWPGGERLHRTGDRVRESASGDLYHLGRVDDQVKIRGFRVAVEEVEGALAAHPDVAAAAVRSWPDTTGMNMLAAYVVPRHGSSPSRATLEISLAKQLPDYMVPGSFTIVDGLPMTSSGKIDRARLPAPVFEGAATDFEEPEIESERKLAEIWHNLLGVDRIGRNDSFFDLGGHSLLAARLLARVSAEWGRTVGMPSLIRARRLRELAALLDEATPQGPVAITIQPRGWRPAFLWTEPGPSFVPLAEGIGLDQPLLGVPLEPTFDASGDARDFRDHAHDFVEAIRRVQPHGPYYLGGWCIAGVLTYAAAVRLEAEGEEVRLLVLGDAFNPAEPPAIDRRWWFRLRFHVRQLIDGSVGRRAYLGERLSRLLIRLRLKPPRPHWSYDEGRAMLDVAAQRYRPERFGGPVLLFQSEDPFIRARMDESWRDRLAGPVTFRRLAGSHETLLFEPHIADVAALLRDALVHAQSEKHAARDRP